MHSKYCYISKQGCTALPSRHKQTGMQSTPFQYPADRGAAHTMFYNILQRKVENRVGALHHTLLQKNTSTPCSHGGALTSTSKASSMAARHLDPTIGRRGEDGVGWVHSPCSILERSGVHIIITSYKEEWRVALQLRI